MAKPKTITRTIKTSTIKAIYADTTNNTMSAEAVVCPIRFKDANKAFKYLKDRADDSHIPVKVMEVVTNETIYAISEEDFIKYGHVVERNKD